MEVENSVPVYYHKNSVWHKPVYYHKDNSLFDVINIEICYSVHGKYNQLLWKWEVLGHNRLVGETEVVLNKGT